MRTRFASSRTWMTALWLAAVPRAQAFDHADSASVESEPAVDLTSLYTWMHDGKLVVAVGVYPNATPASRFDPSTLYVVHVHRGPAYQQPTTETTVVCRFDVSQQITCWPGDDRTETTSGDASVAGGLTSPSGHFRVFAGLRADPEQVNLDGFRTMATTMDAWTPNLDVGVSGCPSGLTSESVQSLMTSLHQGADGGPPVSAFGAGNVLAIVMEVDLSLLRGVGDVLSVWASTHAG